MSTKYFAKIEMEPLVISRAAQSAQLDRGVADRRPGMRAPHRRPQLRCAAKGSARHWSPSAEERGGVRPTPTSNRPCAGPTWRCSPTPPRPGWCSTGSRAVGVEFDQDGRRSEVRARREVVLCGGAVNSPQLLMLSGIGDREQLARHGIDVVAHAPEVGQNLIDHLVRAAGLRRQARHPVRRREAVGTAQLPGSPAGHAHLERR